MPHEPRDDQQPILDEQYRLDPSPAARQLVDDVLRAARPPHPDARLHRPEDLAPYSSTTHPAGPADDLGRPATGA